jgi:glucose-1-phosphate cytidylyltransferase
MKVALLAGGWGTRLSEETVVRPKPLVEIGGRPIMWHIMKTYAHYGHQDFVICLGYKGDVIRDYFLNYEVRHRDVTVTLGTRDVHVHGSHAETGWTVTLAETGESTLTGGRLGRVARFLLNEDRFMVTYGDGVADIDLDRLLAFHKSHGKLATLTAVRPSSRFGEVVIDSNLVQAFQEKPQVQGGWINGGFFVFERAALDIIAGDEESLEQSLLVKLTAMKQLAVFQHTGFWQCMDTPREMELLNELWRQDKAAWAVWR